MKHTKRLISLLLTAVILAGVIVSLPFDAFAANNNNNHNSNVNEMCSWPGAAMEPVGNGIYRFDVPNEYNLLIFCDGSIHTPEESKAYQTADLSFPGGNMLYTAGKGVSGSNTYGVKVCSGSWSAYNDEHSGPRTVYFKSPWGGASIYCWNYGGNKKDMPDLHPTEMSNYHPPEPENYTVNINGGYDFTTDSKWNILGGTNLELDFGGTKLTGKKEGNHVIVSVGGIDDILDPGKSWEDKIIDNIKKNQSVQNKENRKGKRRKGKGFGTAGLDKSFEVEISGFLDMTLDNNDNVVSSTGYIGFISNASIQGEWQSVAFGLPVVFKAKGEINLDTQVKPTFENNDPHNTWVDSVEVTVPGMLTVSGGVGVVYLFDLSAYGSVSNSIKIDKKEGPTSTLSGEIGISGNLFGMEASKALWTGSHIIYPSDPNDKSNGGDPDVPIKAKSSPKLLTSLKSLNVKEDDFKINRSYSGNTSKWLPSENTAKAKSGSPVGADGDGATLLQSNVYKTAYPQLITTDYGSYLFWLKDIPSRSTGNHIALVYSKLDTDSGVWSEPRIVDDDGTSDFYPHITTDGKAVWMMWSNSNSQFNEGVTVSDYASASEIEVARLDPVTDLISADTLTSNDTVDYAGDIAVINGDAHLIWYNNSENDIFEQSGTNTVMSAVVTDDINNEITTVAALNKPIGTTAVGELNGKACYAYQVKDGDTQKLYLCSENGAPKPVSDNIATASGLKFSNISDTNTLTWISPDNELLGTSDMTTIEKLSADGIAVHPSFRFVTSDSKTELLSIESGEECSELAKYSLKDGKWSNPVAVTDDGKYYESFTADYDLNGNLLTAYMLTDTGADGATAATTSLYTRIVGDVSNITLDYVDYDENSAEDGGELPVTLGITNNGTRDESMFLVTVNDSNGTKVNSKMLYRSVKSGKSTDLTLNIPLPETISPSDYKVTVSPVRTDADLSDNSASISFGYTDLSLYTKEVFNYDGSKHGVMAYVSNCSNNPTEAALYIRKDNEFGERIAAYNLGIIPPGDKKAFLIDESEIERFASESTDIKFEVVAEQTEKYFVDNSSIMNIDGFSSHEFNEDELYHEKVYYGDANNDGVINIIDVTSIQKHLAGLTQLSDDGAIAADTNGNGNISINDVSTTQYYLVKLVEKSGRCGSFYTKAWDAPIPEPTAEQPTTVQPTTNAVSDYTITFTDAVNWGGVIYCYYWADGYNPVLWPGKQMTLTGYNEYNQRVYTLNIPSDAKNVIFYSSTAGGLQTVDIPITGSSRFYTTGQRDNNGKFMVKSY